MMLEVLEMLEAREKHESVDSEVKVDVDVDDVDLRWVVSLGRLEEVQGVIVGSSMFIYL